MNLQLTRRYVSWYFLVIDVPLGGLLLYLDVMSTLYQLSSPFADGNLRKTESQPVFTDWDYVYSVGVETIFVLLFLVIHFGLLLMIGYLLPQKK